MYVKRITRIVRYDECVTFFKDNNVLKNNPTMFYRKMGKVLITVKSIPSKVQKYFEIKFGQKKKHTIKRSFGLIKYLLRLLRRANEGGCRCNICSEEVEQMKAPRKDKIPNFQVNAFPES